MIIRWLCVLLYLQFISQLFPSSWKSSKRHTRKEKKRKHKEKANHWALAAIRYFFLTLLLLQEGKPSLFHLTYSISITSCRYHIFGILGTVLMLGKEACLGKPDHISGGQFIQQRHRERGLSEVNPTFASTEGRKEDLAYIQSRPNGLVIPAYRRSQPMFQL